MLRDWADGGISRVYRPACYRQALKRLPTDLRVYSSAPDDIRRALSRRVARQATRKLAAYGVAGVRKDETAVASASAPVGLIVLVAAAAGALGLGLAVAGVRRRR